MPVICLFLCSRIPVGLLTSRWRLAKPACAEHLLTNTDCSQLPGIILSFSPESADFMERL